eukprot:3402817-Prymnesium_polylepis.1
MEVLDCHEKWFAELHGVVEEKEEAAAKIREMENAAAGDSMYDEIRECKRHKKDPDKGCTSRAAEDCTFLVPPSLRHSLSVVVHLA